MRRNAIWLIRKVLQHNRRETTDTDLIRQSIPGTQFNLPIVFPSVGSPIVGTSLPRNALSLTRNGRNNLVVASVVMTPQADGRTMVVSGLSALTAPDGDYVLSIALDSVDSTNSRFRIAFSGSDAGRDLKFFDLYIQIDGGTASKIARIAAGSADTNGTYRGVAEYQALSDGLRHTYRIFTLGIDGSKNVEEAPGEGKGIEVSATYATTTPPTIIDFNVQKGATSRSFVS